MAKTKTAAVKRATRQRRKWPNRADLAPWLQCYLDVCEQYPRGESRREGLRPAQATCRVRIRKGIARTAAAVTRPLAAIRVRGDRLTGADRRPNLPGSAGSSSRNKYLQLAEVRQSVSKPPVQAVLESKLKYLLAANGLPPAPGSSSSGVDGALRRLGKQRQSYCSALLAGDLDAAATALQKTTKPIAEIDKFVLKPGLTLSAIKAFRRLGDDAGLATYLTWLDRNEHSDDLATGSLWGMGLTELAKRERRIWSSAS